MTELQPDTAGVIVPPPLLALSALVFGLLLDWLFPAYVIAVLLSQPQRIGLGLVLAVAGFALSVAARRSFLSAGTNVKPWKPSMVLVTGGIFGRLRNPMYVGGIAALAGIALALAADWMLVLTIVSALILHFGVVRREERYLEAKFGDAYRRYRAAVPRYGWRMG